MPQKPKKSYTPFEDAQILWECDFPNKPELLESLIKERIENQHLQTTLKEREKQINSSILAFFSGNRLDGILYEGYALSKKSGSSSTINREALMLAGVTKEVIDKCISRTPWETVECRLQKENKVETRTD